MSELELGTLYDMLAYFPRIEELWELEKYQGKIVYALTGDEFRSFMAIKESGELERVINDLETGNIGFVCYFEQNYPEKFIELDYPLFVVYYRGDISLLNGNNIAIVGSRACTRYGKEQTDRFSKELSKAGFNIVSGLAEGIDGCAHTGALKANGKTISVVANGLKSIFPAINVDLAREIVATGGVLISEFYPDYKPKGFSFVQRNRLIAAASEAVLVVEAGKVSGALHTVNFALDLGREVFAIPGNCNSSASEGTNNLIKKFYSMCVTSPQEIISQLNCTQNLKLQVSQSQNPIKRTDKISNLNETESLIYNMLQTEDAHFDEILEKTQIEAKKLLVLLTTMEIRGLIRKLPANYFGKKD
ncbi:MAG: DNA-processing protein DprA [Clostridia bacterium]|nr:DNA-processing protein DprA [Clostridia bacterium]